MTTDDLKEHATSDHDFYALLGIEPTASESDIRRAYRKTALKYHPDKNAGNPAAVATFHLLQTAQAVLADVSARAAYDSAREARAQKRRRDELFEGKRKQMKEDLERRESGVHKRMRTDDFGGAQDDAEERLAREIRRLAEDGKRRRREREEMLRRERDREREGQESSQQPSQQQRPQYSDPSSTSWKNGSAETPATASPSGRAAEMDATPKSKKPRQSLGGPGTPKFSFTPKSASSPGLEELTLQRLRNAEKKRLEQQIKREDEESARNAG